MLFSDIKMQKVQKLKVKSNQSVSPFVIHKLLVTAIIFYNFVIGIQNWDQIYWIFKRNQITIHYLSNKSNLNTDTPNIFKFD